MKKFKLIKLLAIVLFFVCITSSVYAQIINVTANNSTYVAVQLDSDVVCTYYGIQSKTGSKFYLKEKNEVGAPFWTMDDFEKLSIASPSRKKGAILIWVKSDIASDVIEVITVLTNN